MRRIVVLKAVNQLELIEGKNFAHCSPSFRGDGVGLGPVRQWLATIGLGGATQLPELRPVRAQSIVEVSSASVLTEANIAERMVAEGPQ